MKFLGFNFFARKQEVEIPPQVENEELMFMNCVIKMNRHQQGWQKARMRIIDCIKVCNYKWEQDGTMIISGMSYPVELLRTIANSQKKAKLCCFEYGNCSSYLFGPSGGVPRPPPPNPPSNTPAAGANDHAARGTGNATEVLMIKQQGVECYPRQQEEFHQKVVVKTLVLCGLRLKGWLRFTF